MCGSVHTHTHIPHKCVCAYIRTVAVAMVVVVVVVVILAVDVSCTHTQDPSTNRSTCTYMQAHVIFRHTHDIFVIASTNINGWCAGCFKVVAVLLHISFCHCAVYICIYIYTHTCIYTSKYIHIAHTHAPVDARVHTPVFAAYT